MTDQPLSQPLIRRFAESDSVAALTRLLHRAYRPLLLQGFHYVASQQSDEITERRIAQGECYVAVLSTNESDKQAGENEQLVGTVTLRTAEFVGPCDYYSRDGVVSFQQFAVDPSLQGQGIGTFLLQHVEQRARELQYCELALDTAEGATQLIEMYRSFGFSEVSRVDWGVTNYESVIMSKPL